jgi:hypothetical protein
MKKAKVEEVSRRDFIRDIGGGAIGAAIISTQFLDSRRVDAADKYVKLTVKAGINVKGLGNRWKGIREVTQTLLKEFEGLGAKQVNWRLNESGKSSKSPVFIDWLAVKNITDSLAKKSGVKDYGVYRLGDSLPSNVYDEGLDKAGKDIVERDWGCDQLLKEKRVESRLLVQKAGLMYQRFIGIIAEQEGSRRGVGLLTVSFEKKPSTLEAVDAKMKQWASWPGNPKSGLVEYIEQNFVLGGPAV